LIEGWARIPIAFRSGAGLLLPAADKAAGRKGGLVMPRDNTSVNNKVDKLGHIIKAQHVIDFVVLSELQANKQLYVSELHKKIFTILGNIGVNDSYLSARLKKLAENGHVIGEWKGDGRYNRYYTITEKGREYFLQMLRDLPGRVKKAHEVYSNFEKYLGRFGKVNLK
jgi:DNA-binding PadR family transcriptional regulator